MWKGIDAGAARRAPLRDRPRDPDPRRGRRLRRRAVVRRPRRRRGVPHRAGGAALLRPVTPISSSTPGMTFTIEPMINEGSWELGRIWPDGWTAPTPRRLALRAVRAQPPRHRRPASRCSRSFPANARELRHTADACSSPVASAAVRLAGERALVTGSTAGIGRAIAAGSRPRARRSSSPGATPSAAPRSSPRSTARAARPRFVAADLHDEAACTALVDDRGRPASAASPCS